LGKPFATVGSNWELPSFISHTQRGVSRIIPR